MGRGKKPSIMSVLGQEPDAPADDAGDEYELSGTPASEQTTDEEAGTLPLTARITALERRVVTLEGNSGKGRADLKNDLQALKMTVDMVKGGGAGSLEHTAGRVSKAEKEIVSLEGALDKQ